MESTTFVVQVGFGVQFPCVNDAVTPVGQVGKLEVEKTTDCGVPPTNRTLMVLCPDPVCATLTLLVLESVKVKGVAGFTMSVREIWWVFPPPVAVIVSG